MKTIVIEADLRTDLGKKATRELRSKGLVPGIIYGGEKEIKFFAPAKSLKAVVYTSDFMIAELKIDGKSYPCILKDLQFDVVTDALNHVDFLELVEGKKVIAELPLNFVGQPKGVIIDGGRLELKMNRLKVKTYPKYLVENIEVDISKMRLLDNIRVEDVKAENMEIMNARRQPIASISLTRALRQEGGASAVVLVDDEEATEEEASAE